MIGSITVFLLFTTFRIENKHINRIASFSFFIYLIHDEEVISRPLLTELLGSIYKCTGIYYFLIVIIYACLLYFICSLFYGLFLERIIKITTQFIYEKLKTHELLRKLNLLMNKVENKILL